jgi:hypothetical protein
MEKLSIEEKAKRYDLAIEAAKSIHNNMKEGGNFGGIEDLEVIFPELIEKEDEKMVKAITEGIHDLVEDFGWNDFGGIPTDDIFAWLEKQGVKKSIDKNESKFKIKKGRWYVCTRDLDDNYGTRAFRKGNTYYSTKDETLLPDNSNIPFEIKYYANDYFRIWTIQDAKDGDVLQFKDRPFIYNGYLEEKKYPFTYGGIYLDGSFFVSNGSLPWAHSDVYPATKEKRDFLFQKMKEDGYEWNAEKKELKKIERKFIEWTEEDINMFGSIRSTLSMYMNNLSLPKEIRNIHKKELKWFDELYDRGLS